MGFYRRALRLLTAPYFLFKRYGQHLPLAFEAIFSMPCYLALIRGNTRGGGPELKLLYVGRRRNYEYLVRTVFETHEVITDVHSNLLCFSKEQRRLTPQADITLCDIGWPYHGRVNRRNDYLVMPDWASMSLDLAGEWADVVRRFRHTTRNNDLRLIRRNGFGYVCRNDRETAQDFYDRFYLPFVSYRHGDESIVAPREHVIGRATKGAVLQVIHEGEAVAAGVVFPEDDVLYFLWMGVAAECVEEPPEAAVSALYYFGIKYAYESGYEGVDFTGTRPFLNDGAFRFKRKWGVGVWDTFSPSSILVRPQEGKENAAHFCERFPMLVRRNGSLEAIFLRTGKPVDDAYVKRIESQYLCPGMQCLTIVDTSGSQSEEERRIECDGYLLRVVGCSIRDFTKHYRKGAENLDAMMGSR